MADQQEIDINEAVVKDMPVTTKQWVDYICKERKFVIQDLAQKSKKPGFDIRNMKQNDLELHERLQVWFRRFDYLEMTPKIKADTKVDQGLALLNDARFRFLEADKEKARSLLEKWEGERWGANEVVEEEESSEEEQQQEEANQQTGEGDEEPARKRRKSSTVKVAGPALLPPPGHAIFGRNGIFHGIALKSGGRKTPVLDPRYLQRPAKVYGHNGLRVGAWFPLQLVALFRGAHGVRQGGIAGNRETGAYSIVVSGHYDDLDRDNGNTILYSGSNSHDNTNPDAPAPSSGGTLALEASWATQNPIRVLRSASGKSKWAPPRGLRYDGLYRVVQKDYPKNTQGGMYERFRLERIEGQREIDRSRPTNDEIRDFEKYPQGY